MHRLLATLAAFALVGCGRINYDATQERDPLQEIDASAGSDAAAEDDASIGIDAAVGSDAGLPSITPRTFALGERHSCAIRGPGAVRCWGQSALGQLGYENIDSIGDDEAPATAGDVPLGGNAIFIAAGRDHTCAVLDTGAARCWGDGIDGQLGYANVNSIGDDETPASVGDVELGGNAVSISAGRRHTCALLDTGAVRCWGSGANGRLGYGNLTSIGDNETPATAGDLTLGGSAVTLASGRRHNCILLGTGAVRCWGQGSEGQLGYGNTDDIGDDETPASVGDVDLGGSAVAIATGRIHTCALLDTGAVRCWGDGGDGQLGYGNTNVIGDDETPASAGDVDLGGNAVAITAGYRHTCALLDTGAVRCWGSGSDGQLGYANINGVGDDETPASVGDVALGGNAVAITAGRDHTCARLDTGALRCWGDGTEGQLGYGNTDDIGDDETPSTAGDVPYL